ncbi:hypothetical protein DAPK24_039200 [Pichia kluyveri]|uniref:CCHC-type domain-containing protein n=1 Tax=Pichia kluyveri TaxID=36015 RepID=A0AAV5R7Q5_PICKL|nr:hypothetical protein DAPK24_039200 [Pichia kluyveri]
MDIYTRAVTVQQVISHFALACPKDESSKLVSAVNYPMWDNMTKMTLAAQGVGMDNYFESGDMLIPDGDTSDDVNILKLQSALENGIQTVLMNTVSRKILRKYQGSNLFGYNLLCAIRRDYAKVSPRQLFDMVKKAADAALNKSASDKTAVSLLRDICAQAPTVQELTGLFYLMMFKSDQACSRILDAPDPDVNLSVVENKLRDMVSSVSTSYAASGSKTTSSNVGSSSSIMCYRCNKKGHTARNCLAPAPASRSKSNTSDSKPKSESNNNSGVGWSVYNTTDVTEVARESYGYKTQNEDANIDTTVAIEEVINSINADEEVIGSADENENVNLDVGSHRPLNQSPQDEDNGPQLAGMEMLDEYDSAEDEEYVPNETASDISSVTGRSETQTETTTVLAGTELDDYFDYMNEHDLFHNVHAPMMPYMLEQGDLLDDIQMVESNFEIMRSNNILNEDSEVINILPDASNNTLDLHSMY